MARKRREKILDITREEIKETARGLMAINGTAGLSLRAIAREMGMTAPALYHYYASLNDLITALILDAFTQLADTLETTAADPALTTVAERLTAVANANRQWALDHPLDFQLIYGNPIPDYEQPADITYPRHGAALESPRVFLQKRWATEKSTFRPITKSCRRPLKNRWNN